MITRIIFVYFMFSEKQLNTSTRGNVLNRIKVPYNLLFDLFICSERKIRKLKHKAESSDFVTVC